MFDSFLDDFTYSVSFIIVANGALAWVLLGNCLEVRTITLCFRYEDRTAALDAVLLHLFLVWLDVRARAWDRNLS